VSFKHKRQLALREDGLERIVLAIKTVRHNGLEANARRYHLFDKVQDNLWLGVESSLASSYY